MTKRINRRLGTTPTIPDVRTPPPPTTIQEWQWRVQFAESFHSKQCEESKCTSNKRISGSNCTGSVFEREGYFGKKKAFVISMARVR